MSVNKFKPHIFVLPEDRANEEIATGFLSSASLNLSAIDVLGPAGGWLKVVEYFEEIHAFEMDKNSLRYMILLFDFDEDATRLEWVQKCIPAHLKERVYVIGVWSEPEKLRKSIKMTFESIGIALAQDCQDELALTWNHALLKHNANEKKRVMVTLRPILFP